MKLVRVSQVDGLQTEIRKRFADFNRSKPPSKGRRYPDELRQLVAQAAAQGIKLSELSRLTGLSSSGVRRWVPKASLALPAAPRRLEVVGADEPLPLVRTAAVVVRLLSGVTIELADGRALTGDLLAALSAPEVQHAASR